MKFIIWDPRDGMRPTSDEEGNIIASGAIGRVGPDNVYLTTYGARPENAPRYEDLPVGGCVRGVQFSLSGSKGTYDVYRVE